MARKKLKKRLDYPFTVFRQIDRINTILSTLRMTRWGNIELLEQGVFGLEAEVRMKIPGDNVKEDDEDYVKVENLTKEIKDIMDKGDPDKSTTLFEKIRKKHLLLMKLVEKIGLTSDYQDETSVYGADYEEPGV